MVPQHLRAKGAKKTRREEEQDQAIDARLDKENLTRYPLVSTCFGDTAGGVRISSVEWKPLNAASIQKARWENKLLFLHIGYPGCHGTLFSLDPASEVSGKNAHHISYTGH